MPQHTLDLDRRDDDGTEYWVCADCGRALTFCWTAPRGGRAGYAVTVQGDTTVTHVVRKYARDNAPRVASDTPLITREDEEWLAADASLTAADTKWLTDLGLAWPESEDAA